MTKVVLNSRSYHADHEWVEWRPTYLPAIHTLYIGIMMSLFLMLALSMFVNKEEG